MGLDPSETRGSRSLGRLPSILCQAATWQPGCAQASFSWPSAGRHSWPHCQPITQKDVVLPCQCLLQTESVFLGPLSHSLLQLSTGCRLWEEPRSLGPLGQGEVSGSSGSHPSPQHTHPQPSLRLCFDFLCVRPTMGNQGSAFSSSLQEKK